MDDGFLSILPPELVSGLRRLSGQEWESLQELRLRCGCPATFLSGGAERVIPCGCGGYVVDRQCLQGLVNRATRYSTYSASAQLRQGFFTLRGGHRLGLCGQAVMGEEGVRTLRDFTSANLRIARQLPGCGKQAAAFVRRNPGSTLIAGPPGCGKTTLLRELIRVLSDEDGFRVGVADERMELAACSAEGTGFSVGRMTDVLSGVPKHEAIYMLVRTMNPDWIAVDEITDERDVDALLRTSFCGVRVLASAHVFCREDLWSRPLYARMCRLGLFENLILMDKQHGVQMERMNGNDETAGCGADYRIGLLGGNSDGTGGTAGGAGSSAGGSCA